MSKLITVWGAPETGKTVISVKLTLALEKAKHSVIYLSPDFDAPALPVIFPCKKKDDMVSLGAILSRTEITADDILKNTVTFKEYPNVGFIGYIDGENRYTYPKHDETKVRLLLSLLRSMVDYVVVDCNSNLKNNIVSSLAIRDADCILRLTNPTLKCVSYYSSNLPLFGDVKYRSDEHLLVLNNTDNLPYMPTEEAKAHYRNIRLKMPFSSEIKMQLANGELMKDISNKRYNKSIESLVKVVSVADGK